MRGRISGYAIYIIWCYSVTRLMTARTGIPAREPNGLGNSHLFFILQGAWIDFEYILLMLRPYFNLPHSTCQKSR
jgi:hypothetical protein